MFIAHTKEHLLSWLYSLGDGRGLPKSLLPVLEDEHGFSFRRTQRPVGESVFAVQTSAGRSETRTPIYGIAMDYERTVLEGSCYLPQLEDFEVSFSLPAVLYHSGRGAVEVVSLSALHPPTRRSLKRALVEMVSASGELPSGMSAEWLDAASEFQVRDSFSSAYGLDFRLEAVVEAFYEQESPQDLALALRFIQGRPLDGLL